jgi:anti-sigma factor ChrR (cupin superfamily)
MNINHPPETSLALFASGDAGPIEQWRIQRHVGACGECRESVAKYSALRSEITDAGAPADISWNKLAAEMRANIRLGLEAGECVNPPARHVRFFGARSLAACGSLAVLLVAALWLERPVPRVAQKQDADQIVLESTSSGIQVTEGGQTLGLLHGRARSVDTFASGVAMRARYVDADTGNVTINNVYVQ